MRDTRVLIVFVLGLMILAVGVTLTDGEPWNPDDTDEQVGLGGGGDEGDSYTRVNNTIVVNNESADPILAGTFAQGEVANIFVVNLTNQTDYTLVDPDGNEIGNLTALDEEIRWYKVDIETLGTWALYRTEELDLLGLLDADPVVTFDVDDTLSTNEVGTTAFFIPSSELISLDHSVQPCSYVIEDGEVVLGAGTDYENDKVDISGTETVEVLLNWTVREGEDTGNLSEFYIDGKGENVDNRADDAFREASADFEVGADQGNVSIYLRMEEGEKYVVRCQALGDAAGPQALLDFADPQRKRVEAT